MTVILCHCVHRHLLDSHRLDCFRRALSEAGVEIMDTVDLCDLAQCPTAGFLEVLQASDTAVCGCHHRSLAALLAFASGEGSGSWRTVDLRSEPIEVGLGRLALPASDSVDSSAFTPPVSDSDLDAWYPVIDRQRCTDCGRCREYCLFGVYGESASGPVTVSSPLNCKTDCPACARICPQNAIIFPKSSDVAINGADVSDDVLATASIRLNPEELAAGNIYAKLKARRQASRLPPLFRQGLFKPPSSSADAAGDESEGGRQS